MPPPSALTRALLLGAVSGLRSLAASALLSSRLARTHSRALDGTPLAPLAGEGAARALKALAAGEFVCDKLPGIPARISPAPLLGRALLGALAGAGACARERKSLAAGAAVGAGAAVAAAFAAYHLRAWLDKNTPLPDPLIAVTEDALALGVGTYALRS